MRFGSHVSAALLCALLSVMPPLSAQTASTEAFVEVARYFNMSGSAFHYARQSVEAIRLRNAAAAEAVDRSLSYWDQDVADRRMATLLQSRMTISDAQAISRFGKSSVGEQLAQTFRKPPEEWITAVSKLPASERLKAEAFLRSAPASKALKAFDSEASQSLWRNYGEELMCMHFAKADQSALVKLHSNGKCLAFR
jgi:hypothetical protein